MYRAVIIEDDAMCMEALCDLLEASFPDIHLEASCTTAEEGILLVRKHKPDLVLLDINLPLKSGFEMLEELKDMSFSTIFTTSFEKHALKAHDYDSVCFIAKPVTRNALSKSLEKIKRQKKNLQPAQTIENLISDLKKIQNPKKIAVPEQKVINYINVDDITRMEADGNYTRILLSKGKSLMASRQIGDYEKLLLEQGFFRIHDKHLINLHCVKSFLKGDLGLAVMNDGSVLPVARRRKEEFLKSLDSLSV